MLDSGAFLSTGTTSSATEGGGTTTPSTGGAGGTTTTPNGGGGAGGTTTTPNGGGGTGGTTTTDTTGGGGTGGTTTTTPTTPTSCKDAKDNFGATGVKLTEIDPDGDGDGMPFSVLCDQEKDGGGWALLYNSVSDPENGQTTAFWNIPYDQRFVTKGEAAINKNYYAAALYRHGKEYRDDAMDEANVEVLGIMRATATGINETTMKLTQPVAQLGNLSVQIYAYHFAGGWSASDYDGDSEVGNCAAVWANVTQHYAGCWKYSLGADAKDGDPGAGTDYSDGGWGPHIINAIIDEINVTNVGNPPLAKNGTPGEATRMKRISRFTRW